MRNFSFAIVLLLLGLVPNIQRSPSESKRANDSGTTASKIPESLARASDSFPKNDLRDSISIIATIPNPKLTHLAVDFDRWIESLQRAAEANGYRLTKQWIPTPWPSKESEYKYPGVMIFHKTGEQKKLVIFLVGESPLGGICKTQFEAALKYQSQIKGIVAPCFSGSLGSLRSILEKKKIKNKIKDLTIATGSATNQDADALCSNGFCRDRHLTLESTVDDDATAARRFHEYSDKRNIPLLFVADVSENDTAYGKAAIDEAIKVIFPRDISVLRREYHADEALERSLTKSNSDEQTKYHVVSETDLSAGQESLPVQARIETAASDELEMQNISQSLREGNFNLALLRATNPLDILFLRQYWAQRVPDLPFYLLEPDVLFIHSPEIHAFHGSLALSRYPLFSVPGQQKTSNVMAFPSKSAEGVYWAARLLLGPDHTGQSGSFWISIVGLDEYWPVAGLAGDRNSCVGDSCPPPEKTADSLDSSVEIQPTRVYVFFWIIAVAALFVVFYAALQGFKCRRKTEIDLKPRAPHRWYADFFFDPKSPLTCPTQYCAYSLVLGITGLVVLLSIPLCKPWGLWTLAVALPAVPALWFCLPSYATSSKQIGQTRLLGATNATIPIITRVLTGLNTVVLAVLFFVLYFIWKPDSVFHWPYFAAYRSVHLGNGVNPTLPLVFLTLALIASAWFNLQRFVFSSQCLIPLCLPECDTLGGTYKRARDIFASYATFPGAFAGIVTATLVFVSVTVIYGSALTIEGHVYDLLLMGLLALSSGLTMMSVCQFLQAWWNLSDFLRGLQELPIRRTFAKLSRDLGSIAIFSSTTRERSYLYTVRARHCLRAMPWMPNHITEAVERHVDVLLAHAAADERETCQEAMEAQANLVEAESYLLRFLQTSVWSKGDSELDNGKEPDAHTILAEEFVALRILGFIRYAMLQLRSLLTFFSVAFILQALAVSCYPFFLHSLSKIFVGMSFAILVAAAGYVLIKMGRDVTLRSLSSDKDGKDHPIALQALQSASLPILAFASTYFPDLGDILFGSLRTFLTTVN